MLENAGFFPDIFWRVKIGWAILQYATVTCTVCLRGLKLMEACVFCMYLGKVPFYTVLYDLKLPYFHQIIGSKA